MLAKNKEGLVDKVFCTSEDGRGNEDPLEKDCYIELLYRADRAGWETLRTAPIEVGRILSEKKNEDFLANGEEIIFKTQTETGQIVRNIIKSLGNVNYINQQKDRLDNIDTYLIEKINPVLDKYKVDVFSLLKINDSNYEQLFGITKVFFEFLVKLSEEVNDLVNQKMPVLTIGNLRKSVAIQERQKDLDKFRKNFAHDFCRTPFSSILSFFSWFKEVEDLEKEERLEIHESIKGAINGMSGLFMNVIGFAQKPDFKELRGKNIMEGEWGMLEARAREKGIVLVSDIDEEVLLFSDERFVMGILRNLINNSIKFQSEGEIKFSLKQREDYRVELIVDDRGKGIDNGNLEKIQQMLLGGNTVNLLSKKGTNGERGTGEGIPEIVERSREIFIKNGDITLETSNMGTKYIIIFPTKEEVLRAEVEKEKRKKEYIETRVLKETRLKAIVLNNAESHDSFDGGYLFKKINPIAYKLAQEYYGEYFKIRDRIGRTSGEFNKAFNLLEQIAFLEMQWGYDPAIKNLEKEFRQEMRRKIKPLL